MKTNLMKSMRLVLMASVAACTLVLGNTSLAIAGNQMPQASPMSTRPADDARRRGIEERIRHLHDLLKITPEQETQWSAVAQVMHDNASSMDSAMQDREQTKKTMSAIDDLSSYQAIIAAHAEGLKNLISAFTPLYSAMSELQQKNADAVFGHRVEQSASRMHK